ncbi:uncharacterized protein AMSG_06903 [Thecamonas trahens ATCC 50062]|uniref:LIM zinc-binding domain-containing protein n=1 Tax=Thecamonas trahens ATCC 50062 TaxID=461836 RepID=A0A0L0DDI6_THETB|nr:hypothetical protein AMSG_06903 [Thecamonas trahens ATCC 50062]KNC50412.1 hypothetical protein AMSG_06903 [Thecamonas trahens ATCC 50062]|eukprot:XP_013756954.1 hypothetical protein AMSG_06903 [Thecamonas trahens ATCC 50062]
MATTTVAGNIVDGDVVSADNAYWHAACFVCAVCKVPLAHAEYVTHGRDQYCQTDFVRHCCCLLCWDPLPVGMPQAQPRVHDSCLDPREGDALSAHVALFRSLMAEMQEVISARDIGRISDATVYVVRIAHGIQQLCAQAGVEYNIKEPCLNMLRLVKPFVVAYDQASPSHIEAAWSTCSARSTAVTRAVRTALVAVEGVREQATGVGAGAGTGAGAASQPPSPSPSPSPSGAAPPVPPARPTAPPVRHLVALRNPRRRMSSELDSLVAAEALESLDDTEASASSAPPRPPPRSRPPAAVTSIQAAAALAAATPPVLVPPASGDLDDLVEVAAELDDMLGSLFCYNPSVDFEEVSRASLQLLDPPSPPLGAPTLPLPRRQRSRMDPLRSSRELLQAELERELQALGLLPSSSSDAQPPPAVLTSTSDAPPPPVPRRRPNRLMAAKRRRHRAKSRRAVMVPRELAAAGEVPAFPPT